MDDPLAWPVALGAMDEAYKIGTAKKINFSFNDPVQYVSKFGENLRNARPSMFFGSSGKEKGQKLCLSME